MKVQKRIIKNGSHRTFISYFNHQNILAYSHRPFCSVEEMNEGLIQKFNARVKPEDTAYILGDFMLGHNFKTNLPWIVSRLNGYKILVKGNHDRKPELYLSAGFAEVHHSMMLSMGEHYVLLQHKPPEKTHGLGGYPYSYVLHGHVHELFKTKGYWINVGVDVRDYEPKTFEELIDGVEPKDNNLLKKCLNCHMPTQEADSICSHACHHLMWEDDYDKNRKTRKFR